MLSIEPASAARDDTAAQSLFLPCGAGEEPQPAPEQENSLAVWRRAHLELARLARAKIDRLTETETTPRNPQKYRESLPRQALETRTLLALLQAGERLARREALQAKRSSQQDGGLNSAMEVWRGADLALAGLFAEKIERIAVDDGFNLLDVNLPEARLVAALALAGQRLSRIETALREAQSKPAAERPDAVRDFVRFLSQTRMEPGAAAKGVPCERGTPAADPPEDLELRRRTSAAESECGGAAGGSEALESPGNPARADDAGDSFRPHDSCETDARPEPRLAAELGRDAMTERDRLSPKPLEIAENPACGADESQPLSPHGSRETSRPRPDLPR